MTAKLLKIEGCEEDAAVREAAESIARGELVVIPTETVYGLAGRDDPSVIDAIYEAKARDRGKPVPLLFSSADDLERHGFSLSREEARLAAAFWPGALTMVLSRGDGTEGVRVPDHALALSIIRACGGVLRVTSANQSGEDPALEASMAVASLGEVVSLILDDGPVSGGVPSTVLKCSNGGFDILREGAISHASITEVLKGV